MKKNPQSIERTPYGAKGFSLNAFFSPFTVESFSYNEIQHPRPPSFSSRKQNPFSRRNEIFSLCYFVLQLSHFTYTRTLFALSQRANNIFPYQCLPSPSPSLRNPTQLVSTKLHSPDSLIFRSYRPPKMPPFLHTGVLHIRSRRLNIA